MSTEQAELVKTINETGNYNDDIEKQLNDALTTFKKTATW
jgi:F-type H+-transporting ATPase subunit alpha